MPLNRRLRRKLATNFMVVGISYTTSGKTDVVHVENAEPALSACIRNGYPFDTIIKCPACGALLDIKDAERHHLEDHARIEGEYSILYPSWWDDTLKRYAK